MLGHRGCRLAISYPEIAEMQARAIFEAAVEAAKKTGSPVVPEIMVPLVGLKAELDYVKARIDPGRAGVIAETGVAIDYLVGTMIELPRAALRAHVIAEAAEFFSFGTNDLTQTTFGISRDDASSFLVDLYPEGHRRAGPVRQLDFDGVGELIKHRRRARPEARGRTSSSASAASMAATRRSIHFLRGGRARLCLLFALPRADRPACRRAGGVQRQGLTAEVDQFHLPAGVVAPEAAGDEGERKVACRAEPKVHVVNGPLVAIFALPRPPPRPPLLSDDRSGRVATDGWPVDGDVVLHRTETHRVGLLATEIDAIWQPHNSGRRVVPRV
jgi:hypothetical protein